MLKVFKNIRFYVLLASFLLSLGIYWRVTISIGSETLQTIRLTQYYAFTALAYLYTALLIGPAVYSFTWLPFRGKIYRSRRAIGVSTFYFSLLHAYFAFFKQLGGFVGLGFLNTKYLIALVLSAIALSILFVLSSTSFDAVIAVLTFKRWKLLHRLTYLAGMLIVVHALMLGTHFMDLSQSIPQIFLLAFGFLLFLEARRIDAYFEKTVAVPLLVVGIMWYFIFFFMNTDGTLSFSIHGH